MRSGDMDHWLQIFASTEAAGASGDPQPSWSTTPEFEVWARRRSLSGGEATVAAARLSSENVVFEIFYISGITDKHRLLSDGIYYDINSIRDPEGRREILMIYATSGERYGA